MSSRRFTLNSFRKVSALEEQMMRKVMPRASAASPESLKSYGFEKTYSTRPSVATPKVGRGWSVGVSR